VVRTLATLPPRERDVVGCRDVVGLDVEATATALGISSVAVRVAHHRGLRRLRDAAAPMGPMGPTGPGGSQPGSSVRSRSR
jgi:RNA polymerase sigma-70 factor (ECF subfamily)